MRILNVISDLSPDKGGPPKAATEMCQALAAKGHDVTLYTTNMVTDGTANVSVDRPLFKNGYVTYYYPIGKFRKWSFSIALARSLKNNLIEFDIVHIHSLYLFHTFITAYYCRKFNIPYIIRPHGTLDPYIRKKGAIKKAIYHLLIENRNLNHAAAIHYTAEDEMKLAHKALNIQAPAMVIPLGLNLEVYSNLPERGSFRLRYLNLRNKFIILFLGRISPKKGLDLLLEAYRRVQAINADLHLVIAGPEESGYGKKVHEWVKIYKIEERITFTGMLIGKEKLSAFVDADLFVLPSYSENFGIAILEAMACGVPVITTNQVNIWREIEASEAGEIIDCNASALGQALTKMIGNQDLRDRYAKNGRKLVETKYDWNKVVDDLIYAYKKIIDNG